MKKIHLSVVAVILCLFSFSIKAQQKSVPTIIVKDKVNELYFKRRVEFVFVVTGYSNETEVKNLCSSIASNGTIEKCEVIGNDGNGNYDVKLVVKSPQEFSFYKGIALKNNVSYVVVNDEKKAIADLK